MARRVASDGFVVWQNEVGHVGVEESRAFWQCTHAPVPAVFSGSRMHQSLSGRTGQEPSLSCSITSRLAGIRGGPQGAVSDVGDPTERLTSLPAFRLAKRRRCTAPGPIPTPLRESPLTWSILSRPAASPPTIWFSTAGSNVTQPLRPAPPACRGPPPAVPPKPPAPAAARRRGARRRHAEVGLRHFKVMLCL